jgi:hypothetical protein
MSKRLQVLLDEAEFAEVCAAAKRSRMTTSEWARQALRAARRSAPKGDMRKKLDVVRAAARHEFPTADIDQMLREIDQGYTSGHSE